MVTSINPNQKDTHINNLMIKLEMNNIEINIKDKEELGKNLLNMVRSLNR